MNERILLIEDEPGLVKTLGDRLRNEGYLVSCITDGDEGFTIAQQECFQLILLDVMLPGKNGFDICRDLRRAGIGTPILMLTARGLLAEKVVGLKLGADDYLTKPFETMELLARIEALLRRAAPRTTDHLGSYRFGNIEVDFRRAEVMRAGEPIKLTSRELALLRCFILRRESLLTRDELLNEVWNHTETPYTRTVDVHVAALRQKLESDPRRPQFILTVHGSGYKFVG